MLRTESSAFINDRLIEDLLELRETPSRRRVDEILARAETAQGLDPLEVAALLRVTDDEIWHRIFRTARAIKERIYGRRIVLFAPLYLSNHCVNGCSYCGYHAGSGVARRRLSMDEIRLEVAALERMGHKRLAVEAGEDPKNCPMDYILEAIDTIYQVSEGMGNIRRLNLNIAATTVEDYRLLKAHHIGTYILFQETYHRPTYVKVHPTGPKHDYDWHLLAFDRAMSAGLDDVGAGVLFGLADYRYELLALLMHARHLEECYGAGPHTVSVPRLRPAQGVHLDAFSHHVDDNTFKRIVALIRLAMPYAGIILSTREESGFRREVIELGVSQISAASCTGVGGYSAQPSGGDTAQFEVGDGRSVDEVLADLCRHGYIPSFCTACYRKGRTGDRFMELAKSGQISRVCGPNALLTFEEYLADYASPDTAKLGREAIESGLHELPSGMRNVVREGLERVRRGERDLYY